ncbi:MAG TPA: type IV secretory system conjugative DNA transfer family protein [Stellaceae bacterium]|nr:type IV secretory system conjugative DNA transfer family protein [Stellaceae bacterium]
MGQTPRLEKILRATLYALAVRDLTLAEGPDFLRASDPDGLRRRLSCGLPDPVFQTTWNELNELPRKEFAEHVESTVTRLSRFLTAPAMRLVVGQTSAGVDFKNAMDNSEVVLVHLGSRGAFSYENARVLGAMLINDLFLSALRREEQIAKRRPFTLYIDEAYDFLSGDIERILDQTRKFGLHAVLAHQRIGQLKERGEDIYNAVMGGTQTKIVLGGLSDDDAEIMAREIMRAEIELERPKWALTAPVVVGEETITLNSESTTETSTTNSSPTRTIVTTDGSATASGATTTYTAAEGETPEQWALAEAISEIASRTIAEGFATTEGYSHGYARSRGSAEALKSIREERPTTLYSLEEGLHLAQVALRNLPDRTAIVKRRGLSAVRIETPEVRNVLKLPRALARFRKSVGDRSPYLLTVTAAEAVITERRRRLSRLIEEPAPSAPPPPLKDEGWG